MIRVPPWITPAAGGWQGPVTIRTRRRPQPTARAFTQLHRIPWQSPVLTGVINTAGQAIITMGPQGGATWYPHEATVFCSTNPTYQAFAQVYRGGTNGIPQWLLGSSFTGSGDTIGLPGGAVRFGDALIAVFTQGQPGARVTIQYQGEQDVIA